MATLTFGFNRNDATLIWNFFKMHLRDKYLGSSLGMIWSVANPLMQLAIFTYIFGYVFKIRLPGAETTLAYAAWLISGYGPWIAFTESITASAASIVNSSGIIKNMALKTEVLPVAAALSGIIPLVVSIVFLLVLLAIDGNTPTWHAVFVVPVVLLQFAFVASLGFFLAALTVFMRDFVIALPNIMLMLLFVTPIFYPIDSMPRIIQVASRVNPFYILAEGYRQPLIHHHRPSFWGLLFVAVLSLVLAYFGLKLFRRVKGYFTAML